jgi:hypothetical protein
VFFPTVVALSPSEKKVFFPTVVADSPLEKKVFPFTAVATASSSAWRAGAAKSPRIKASFFIGVLDT